MKLEDQVCSLSLSKKLKELGVKQESLFYWVAGTGTRDGRTTQIASDNKKFWDRHNIPYVSAFTVAELGEMLPEEVNIPFRNGRPRKVNNVLKAYFGKGATCRIIYAKQRGSAEYIWINANTEADARAKMLIYLIENKLLPIEQKKG